MLFYPAPIEIKESTINYMVDILKELISNPHAQGDNPYSYAFCAIDIYCHQSNAKETNDINLIWSDLEEELVNRYQQSITKS